MIVENNGYRLALPDWAADRLDVLEDGSVSVKGWILPSRPNSELEVLVGGAKAELALSDPPDGLTHTWSPVAHISVPVTFVARAPHNQNDEVIELTLREDGVTRPLNAWLFPQREVFPVPDAVRRERVHGTTDERRFLRNGCSNHRRIKELADRHTSPSRPLRVLDWGAGSGAVARYALTDPSWDYAGADIDPDNVAWCRQNLSAHRFTTLSTEPPSPFVDGQFDLIFGISVVTHLRESDQLQWLAELQRLLSPTSVLILSVLGGQAEAKLSNGATPILARDGVVFGEAEHAIGRIVGQPVYYGTAYHRESHIRDRWSQWFDIADYLPGGLGHQDLVVLKRRA
jgi:SAM-dependent methyltransferase